jgi:hypothetical protein
VSRIGPVAADSADDAAWCRGGSLITGNLPWPLTIGSFGSRRLRTREGDRGAFGRGRMITYAPTPAFPMLLLVTAVVIAPMRRSPVASGSLTPLHAPGLLLTGFRPVGPARITATADPEQSLASAATARMKRHPTRTQTAPPSTSRWTEGRFLCEASAASCGPTLCCGSPDQKTPDRSSGVFLFLRTPQHIQPRRPRHRASRGMMLTDPILDQMVKSLRILAVAHISHRVRPRLMWSSRTSVASPRRSECR